jgi:hypothetical protein
MTVSEIVSLIKGEYGNRFQLKEAQIVRYLDTLQKIAFTRDLNAFLVWDQYQPIWKQFEFQAAGYVPAIPSDIGKVVFQSAPPATGILRSYNNATRKWVVEVTLAEFFDGLAVAITSGTGTGTLILSGAVTTALGLYPYPNDPLCRKLKGITQATDPQLFTFGYGLGAGDPFGYGSTSFYTNNYDNLDYGLAINGSANPRTMWEAIRDDVVRRGFHFVNTPIEGNNSLYRVVYWRRPPTISGIDAPQDANLIIPEEFHWSLAYQGTIALCDNATYGDKIPDEVLRPYMEPFWDAMEQLYSGRGSGYTQTSEGQP